MNLPATYTPEQIYAIVERFKTKYPHLADAEASLFEAYELCRICFEQDGMLFVCGNGGSMADAIHVSTELNKAFKHNRPLLPEHMERIGRLKHGEELAQHLQRGLRTMVLGMNPAVSSAIDNDFMAARLTLAQELYVFARPGDVLLAISTSGNARNVGYAISVARLLGMPVIGLTGKTPSVLREEADVLIEAPSSVTPEIQEMHGPLYHTLCEMLETAFFIEPGL